MKPARNLFPRIVDRDNLRLAFYRAQRGKRDRIDVRTFAANLEDNLQLLSRDLTAGYVPLDQPAQFEIRDPKPRLITAPSFRERVLHHAIMNVCEPVFEQWLIHDTYACRVGKGRIAALHRAQSFSRRAKYALKLDMRKYFDSIPHARLQRLLRRRIADASLLNLFDQIISAYATEPGRGLPIGSLTSQHLANFYLGHFDRWVKEENRCRFYLRYMDDCAVWADSRAELRDLAERIALFLKTQLGLTPRQPACIYPTTCGIELLGCRILPTHLALNERSRRRYRKKMTQLEADFAHGMFSDQELQQRATSLTAFTWSGGVKSWHYRSRVVQELLVDDQEARTG